jgi:hypothetical protein
MLTPVLLLALLAAAPSPESLPDADTQMARFAQAEATGRLLADTDLAVAAATHAVLALPHADAKMNLFFAVAQGDAWLVYFGFLADDGSQFTPAFVLRSAKSELHFAPIALPQTSGRLLGFARAVSQARNALAIATHNPHVNPILVPEKDAIGVYVLQAGGKPGVVLLGGDTHDRYDTTGQKLLSRVRFHSKVIVIQPRKDPAHPQAQTAGSFHTHVVAEEPTATDVALALLHKELVPMFVSGRSGESYRVDATGKIFVETKLSRDVPKAPGPP